MLRIGKQSSMLRADSNRLRKELSTVAACSQLHAVFVFSFPSIPFQLILPERFASMVETRE
jgi:hypothetical protein